MVMRAEDGLRVEQLFVISPNADVEGLSRAKLDKESLQKFTIPLTELRVHNSIATLLPGTAAADDLGLDGGTFGASNSPVVKSTDLASTSGTLYARFTKEMPQNYVAAQNVLLRIRAAMETVSDTTATLDVEAFKSDGEGGGGSDLYADSAVDINSATFSDKDFVISAGSLSPGDVLDVRIAIAITDGATGSGVVANIGELALLCDTRG